ncbi:SirB2 family protein [Shumkonia mesophila]|uniref:SirB2 family protein n=1 Tax=Shumkonia mesophila TaxID=2838854 RepID=UPI0029348D12|nr:SirB2 family protein [Shumkonia mesophila]
MTEFYPEIRLVHIWAVSLSGSLFAVRGLALLAGAGWPRAMAVRMAAYAIDTTLLTAALMLMTLVGQYPFVDGWLTVKVLLLVVYIGLGIVAFRPTRPPAKRAGFFVTALAVFAFIVSVALAHHPLGIFAGLAG